MDNYSELIKACLKGNRLAQNRLYQIFADKMFGVCLRYADGEDDAKDILQDGFIKVFQNIGRFRHEGSLEGWVRRIMVNVSLEKFRKQHLMHPVEDVSIYEEPQTSDDILAKISAQELMELIQQLSPRYRMVFNLYVMEGMNHKEIGDEMNISVGTSKSNLARAREILKRKVAELYRELGKNNSTA